MKKLLKKIGRFFVALDPKYEDDVRQSVLLVDGSFILPNNFILILKGVRKEFINAKLVVLTFPDKKELIEENFPDVEIILPDAGSKLRRYHLAIKLLFLLKRNFNFVILSSLDISVMAVSLAFAKCPVLLNNRWLQWYAVRERTVADIFHLRKSADVRLKNRGGLKGALRSIGRAFIILPALTEEDIKYGILVVDNLSNEVGHSLTAVRKAQDFFINPDITVLTFPERKQHFLNNFANIKLIVLGENNNSRWLPLQMLRLHKTKFEYVIITALDIFPIFISLLFIRAGLWLYNCWHEWWSVAFRNILDYFKLFPHLLFTVPFYVYLVARASIILVQTHIRLGLMNMRPETEKCK